MSAMLSLPACTTTPSLSLFGAEPTPNLTIEEKFDDETVTFREWLNGDESRCLAGCAICQIRRSPDGRAFCFQRHPA